MTLLLPLLLAACGPKTPDHTGDTGETGETAETGDTGETATGPDVCEEAEARLGYRACVTEVPDDKVFESVTIPSTNVDQLRVGKYAVPARADARLPAVVLDVNNFTLHYDFLVTAFPDLFAGLTTDEYERLILYPDTREFYAGTLALYLDEDGAWYGFTVWDDPLDDTSTVTQDQVEDAWRELQAQFGAGELAFVPGSTAQENAALTWTDAPFPIHNPAEVLYEAYNPGVAYGWLRLYTSDEFVTATEEATFGYQDIVVVEEAPEDIERVVSGIVTGTRQGTLSHLNVRSAARGTPNCYISEPLDALAAWEDQLVRFECGTSDYDVAAATTEEATAWWDALRPDPVAICTPDRSVTEMPGLLELPTPDADTRHQNLCRYGAKGSNLATLYQRIDEPWQLDGFVVPFTWYLDHMESHTWAVDLGDGLGVYSFADTLRAWNADTTFRTDASVRRADLTALQEAIAGSPPDPALLVALSDRIDAVFGDDTVMVRFRSSSNAEDGLDFSGAGLYESASGCLADDLDGDSVGPSRCDASEEDEKPVADAILEVWASLWNMQAWDERDWYGVDQDEVAMGLLVDTRLNDELANIVAFTGNPTAADDDRYLINAQLGDLEVVSAEPGVYPEKILLTLTDGVVTEIDRVSPSSEAAEVLTDAQLSTLGAELAVITAVYPLDDEVPEGHDVLWDMEWKVKADGQLVVKQIRPYLR